jgi:hypothetical protein
MNAAPTPPGPPVPPKTNDEGRPGARPQPDEPPHRVDRRCFHSALHYRHEPLLLGWKRKLWNRDDNNNEDHDHPHYSTLNCRCEQLLAGWKQGATTGDGEGEEKEKTTRGTTTTKCQYQHRTTLTAPDPSATSNCS